MRKNVIRTFLWAALCVFLPGCTGLFFYPQQKHVLTPADLGLNYESIYFESADKTLLHAWLLKAQGAPRGTVVFLHGNAENVSTHIASVYWLPQYGYHVFMLDYRGYGRSAGRAEINGIHEDAAAAIRYVRERSELQVLPVVLYGQSLGGAVALYAAADPVNKSGLAGVIAESAFSGYREIVKEKLASTWLTVLLQYPLALLFEDSFSAAGFVAEIYPLPVLFIHGTNDKIVSASHSSVLYRAAKEPKELWLIPGGGHIGAGGFREYRRRLVEFLGSITHL